MSRTVALALAGALALGASSAYAEVDTSGLTNAQAAAVEAQIAQTRADNVAKSVPVQKPAVQQVNEWIQVGQGVGAGLASAARELGAVANDFVKTPVGQVTMFVIIWKVMGADVLHFVIGMFWLIVLVPGWTYFYAKGWAREVTVTYDKDTGKRIKRETRPMQLTDSDAAFYRAVGLIPYAPILIIGLVILP